MGHTTCCIINCRKNGKNNANHFFKFPELRKAAAQRALWIRTVRKINKSDPGWEPKDHDRICQSHFVGENESKDASSPAYVPTLFADVTPHQWYRQQAGLKRWD
ncbi:hypothetical protein QAD02_013954 [Eretmocerus hayati]|uniref:Uncharacterized protein n=1 Tax=Eretmocerus hayati TaxID=131215 RepID=A0ACC2P466_9HYME|nr:hypothetical protein QAD02_013954 [Eretmocerus hayati]